MTPGHEFVGEVVALGEGAGELYKLQVGDHAISEQIVPCNQCRYASADNIGCARARHLWISAADLRIMGGIMLFPAGALNYKVPEVDPAPSRGLY